MADKRKTTQKTRPKKGKPATIPVPTRDEFLSVVEKVAGRSEGRKRPGGKDRPPERSE